MSEPSIDLHPAIAQLVENLSHLLYVKTIRLFGSRARGDHHPRSDVDLAIECPQASSRDWQAIMDLVEQAETLLPIDCVRMEEAEPKLNLASGNISDVCVPDLVRSGNDQIFQAIRMDWMIFPFAALPFLA